MAVDWDEFLKALEQQEPNQNKPPTQSTMQQQRLELQQQRLELQRQRLELEQQKQQQRTQQKANKNELIIYLFSICLTFATILTSVILFIIILIKG